MGKPGAILLLGVGTFILILGWQGRLTAVWDVVTGGVDLNPLPDDLPGPGEVIDKIPPQPQPPAPQPADSETPKEDGTCGAGRQIVVFRTNETVKKCILATDLAAPGNNGQCDGRYLEVIRVADGLKMCARRIRGGGAVPNDYGWVMQPTGAMVRRYQPNVRATD